MKSIIFPLLFSSFFFISCMANKKEKPPTLDQIAKSIEDIFPKGEDIQVERTTKGVRVSFPTGILFETDKYDLSKNAKEYLKKFARIYIKKVEPHFKNRKIIIEGHTDSTGSRRYNQRLSEKRAKAVYDFLAHCIPTSEMEWRGWGEDKPVASNRTREGRAKNRRVELYLKADNGVSPNQTTALRIEKPTKTENTKTKKEDTKPKSYWYLRTINQNKKERKND